jgi:RNA polymerase sigma-70 factor, ECF subfamily
VVDKLLDRETEARLIADAQRGDTRALDELLRAHRQRIWGVCRRIVGSDADAHDATQEASIAIMRHIGKFDGNAAFSTWVYRIATNASLDELRRRKRRPVATDDSLLEFAGAGRAFDGRAAGGGAGMASADGGFDRRIADRLQVDAALQRLPVEFRTAVVLRDLCDLDYGEIADVLGIPIGTVRSRIARGRAALARPGAGLADPADEDPHHGSQQSARGHMTIGTGTTGNQPGPDLRLTTRPLPPSDSSHP